MYILPSPERVSCNLPEVSVMMMLVVLSGEAVADGLVEEDVDERGDELEMELDLLEKTDELEDAVAEVEDILELEESEDEPACLTDVDETEVVRERLLEAVVEDEDVEEVELEPSLTLTETPSLFFMDPLTRNAESTMYERSVVLLTALLDCALLR
jgi:hypothetical protein